MKIIVALFILIGLTACKDSSEILNFPAAPLELKDCSFFRLENSDGYTIRVARCPNSTTTTTYQVGKTTQSVVTIDGVEYIKKD